MPIEDALLKLKKNGDQLLEPIKDNETNVSGPCSACGAC